MGALPSTLWGGRGGLEPPARPFKPTPPPPPVVPLCISLVLVPVSPSARMWRRRNDAAPSSLCRMTALWLLESPLAAALHGLWNKPRCPCISRTAAGRCEIPCASRTELRCTFASPRPGPGRAHAWAAYPGHCHAGNHGARQLAGWGEGASKHSLGGRGNLAGRVRRVDRASFRAFCEGGRARRAPSIPPQRPRSPAVPCPRGRPRARARRRAKSACRTSSCGTVCLHVAAFAFSREQGAAFPWQADRHLIAGVLIGLAALAALRSRRHPRHGAAWGGLAPRGFPIAAMRPHVIPARANPLRPQRRLPSTHAIRYRVLSFFWLRLCLVLALAGLPCGDLWSSEKFLRQKTAGNRDVRLLVSRIVAPNARHGRDIVTSKSLCKKFLVK